MVAHLIELHQLLGVHLLGLVQRNKLDLLRCESFIREGSLHRCQLSAIAQVSTAKIPTIKIVCSDGDQCALASQVLVELVLQRDEGVVACLCELDVAEDDTSAQLTDLLSLRQVRSVYPPYSFAPNDIPPA
jgi:GMP synthase PP-ATPase subunit